MNKMDRKDRLATQRQINLLLKLGTKLTISEVCKMTVVEASTKISSILDSSKVTKVFK